MIRPLPFALRFLEVVALFAFLLFPFAFPAAQSATAALSGGVTDQNGAVVTGANVTITNTATGLERQATTSDNGSFSFSLLPPAKYVVAAQHEGFAPVRIEDVVLNIGDQKSLQIQLRAGQVSETVQVSSEPSLINESPAVSTVVNRQFVENLPLNGRSFNALIALTPGVVATPSSFSEKGQFSVNGQRPDANYFTVDGVSANAAASNGNGLGQSGAGAVPATSALGGTNNLVSVDALQEFRILTSTYAPEFGRQPGAQVQIVTRSGTNDFHGNVFEYFRNDVFDANDWFANRDRLRKPPIRQNDFGGVIGGPLYLPRFGEGGPAYYSGKNRTFFFFSYEGLRLRQPRVATTNVPTLQTRQNAAVALRPILNVFPLPNGRDLGNGLAEFNASFSDPSSLDATSIRVDHNLSTKLTLFGRYNHAPSESIRRGSLGGSLNSTFPTQVKTDTLTFGATWAISASNSNEFRFNYSKTGGKSFLTLDTFGGAVVPPDSLFFPSPFSSKDALVSIQFLNSASFALGSNVDNIQRQINVVDNHSIVSGAHSLKFGVDYRRLAPTFAPRPYSQVALFSDLNAINTGRATLAQVSANEDVDLFFTNFSAYGQDNWKVNRRLTLTYGLRWDVNPPPSGKSGLEPFAVTNFNNLPALGLAPRGTELYKTTYNNFAPRIGVAYQLSQKPGREAVLRGGVGIFYDMGTASAGNMVGIGTFPFGSARTLLPAERSYPLSPANAAPPPIVATPPVPRITAFDPQLKLPRVYQWNFAVEQSLGSSRALSASYVAAVGRRLLQTGAVSNANPSFPGFTTLINNGDTSDYHALQTQFQQRLSTGLQALVSYTWSHSIDTASTDISSGPNVRQLDPRINRGPSDFDIRHAFNAAVTYNIPAPKLGPLSNAVLRGWSVDTIVGARSAFPVELVALTSVTPVPGQTLFINIRPDLIPGIPLYLTGSQYAGGKILNNTPNQGGPGCKGPFCTPSTNPLRQGTLGRNVLRGFPFNQVDLALRRQFNLTERAKVQFRSEFFNLFNHPNFANPVIRLTNAQFGQSIQMLGRSLGGVGAGSGEGGFNPLYQVGGPRSMQFALKLLF